MLPSCQDPLNPFPEKEMTSLLRSLCYISWGSLAALPPCKGLATILGFIALSCLEGCAVPSALAGSCHPINAASAHSANACRMLGPDAWGQRVCKGI